MSDSFAAIICLRLLCGLRMSLPAVRHALKNYWKDTWQNTMRNRAVATQACILIAPVETKMALDHDLLSIAENRSLADYSQAQDPSHPADPAVSAVAVPCPPDDHLVPCVYIALRCSHCGDLRQALAEPPICDSLICPECARTCSFVLLGSGLTRKQLPFHEVQDAVQTRCDFPVEEKEEKNDSS
jgi:hypothetical protein